MRSDSFSASKLALGFCLAGLLTASQLQAQQPPPAWKQGMPDAMKDSKLAPHPSPLTVTPAEKIP